MTFLPQRIQKMVFLPLVTSSHVYLEIVLMSELVSMRGGWRRFPGEIELDRQNMKKTIPHLDNIFYFCVRRINPFRDSFIVHFSQGKSCKA